MKDHLFICNLSGYSANNRNLFGYLMLLIILKLSNKFLKLFNISSIITEIDFLTIFKKKILRFFRNFKFFLVLFHIFALIQFESISQISSKTNLEIFDSEISAGIEKILLYPEINREQKFVFYVSTSKNNKEEKKYTEQVLRKTADKNNIRYSFAKDEKMEAPDSVYNRLAIQVIRLKAEYPVFIKNGFLGEKTMKRRIISDLAISIKNNSSSILAEENLNSKFEDEIFFEDYSRYESPEYRFTQSIPPGLSLLESIIFPAAVITASAVAAILFFAVRSK